MNKQHKKILFGFLITLAVIGLVPESTYSQFSRRWNLFDRDFGTAIVLNVYRSYGSVFFDLNEEQKIYVWQENEFELYRDMLYQSVKPGFFLVEFTLYPTATFSVWMEKEHRKFYNTFNIYKEFNLVESLGAGCQEPWSMSLFLGQLSAFLRLDDNDEMVVEASGASGLVFTGGLYQIFDNCSIRSNWARIEWKLKGEGGQGGKNHSWDIKVGYRWYGISEISNTATFVFSRSRMDKHKNDWRLGKNSMTGLELQIPISEIGDGFSRVIVSYGKVFPWWKLLLGLKIGFGYENRREYFSEKESFSSEKNKLFELFFQPVVIF